MSGTTFSSLNAKAQQHLSAAASLLISGGEPEDPRKLTAHHADLTDALAHLGQTIIGDRPNARPTRDRRLIDELRQGGVAAPWLERPTTQVTTASGHIAAAARAVRASSDLWSTHHCALGKPRSPEASKLRHPSVLGPAMRHWRALVCASHDIARHLILLDTFEDGMAAEARSFLASYPRPSASESAVLDLPLALARPPRLRAADPLVAITEQVDRIHRHVWGLAEKRAITAAVLMNVAAIGMQLTRAWAQFEDPEDPGPLSHLELWADAAAQLTTVRTPDSGRTVLQLERLELARLLVRCEGAGGRGLQRTSEEKAAALRAVCAEYGRVATLCAKAVRHLSRSSDLYVTGDSVPGEVISRRPDLISHKLSGGVLPAPPLVSRRLEATLHRIAAGRAHTLSGTAA